MKSTINDISDLRGLRATVMGLGLNGGGLACARFLAEHGASVTVTDTKDEASLRESIEALRGLPIRFVLGRHELGDFSGADVVIKNPAVRSDSPYILAAKSVETDISLFLRFSPSPIIAVTGSKGKSSVSTAIHHALSSCGVEAFLGGNIAISPLDFLDRTRPETPVVLELSSWQLADMRGLGVLEPRIAVITSIMPDHMNRYSSMDEYVADKRLIYRDQGPAAFTICNRDDAWGSSFASETRGRVLWYSEAPLGRLPGAWLEALPPRLGYCSMRGDDEAESILPADLLVRGDHQRKNLLIAGLACRAWGLPAEGISRALAAFPGVEHRLERFAERDGIAWYNDSAATIPQAVEAALKSFSCPLILITGGTDKNIDFRPFASIYSRAKKLILLAGSGTDKLIPLLEQQRIPFIGPFDDLRASISAAYGYAEAGDSVLLSPGCTSFGMFSNEFDRGKKFKEYVADFLGGGPRP